MNKTRRRAIQKHRAKETKIEVRRKGPADQNEAKGKPGLTVTRSTSRSGTTGRRLPAAESSE